MSVCSRRVLARSLAMVATSLARGYMTNGSNVCGVPGDRYRQSVAVDTTIILT